jgi:tetratricopeptide (TPR) repeat protein
MFRESEIQELVKKGLDTSYQKFQEKKFEIVCVVTEQILKVDPDNCNAMQLLGLSYSALQRHDDALSVLTKCSEKHPENPETINDLALCYSNKRDYKTAIFLLEKAIGLKPEMASLYGNIGLQHRHLQEYQKAIKYFEKGIELEPSHTLFAMLGGCYGELKNLEKAKEYLEKAIELEPNFAAAHTDLSSVLQLQENWEKGFEEYEWRFDVYDQLKVWKKIYDPNKKWKGEDLSGKRIIVHTEQGSGDSIQFVRYLKPLKKRNAYIIMHCNKSLATIFSSLVDEFYHEEPTAIPSYDQGNKVPDHDYHISVMSLPNVFKSIFTYSDYLTIPKKFDLSNYDANFKVGIVWAGNPQHPNDKNRSCNLEYFRDISKIPEVKLFSLMKDTRPRAYSDDEMPIDLTKGADDIKVVDLQNYINDFSDTASIINSLDLVIGVDTSVMHLVGAMGKMGILLLSWNPDWRWGLDGDDTIWYSSLYILRQKEKGNWKTVFEEAKKLIEDHLEQKKGDTHKCVSPSSNRPILN